MILKPIYINNKINTKKYSLGTHFEIGVNSRMCVFNW